MAERWRIGAGVLAIVLSQWGSPRAAHAGIGACGAIEVEAHAQCEVVAPGASCEARCKPAAVRAACSARLAAECRAECPELPSAECKGDCGASCEADCGELEPGRFDCRGACGADCAGRCEANCKAADDGAACEASCAGSCHASCDASCEGQAPEIDCDGGCEASCEGACEADAEFECQADCQADGRAGCEADVQGGCEVACKGEEGALFCDGQYVDSGDLDACIAALRATLDIEVETSSSGEAGCRDGDGCRAEGRAAAKIGSDCAVAAPGAGARDFSALFGGAALVVLRRLRRQTARV
jgi:hypothetical protein